MEKKSVISTGQLLCIMIMPRVAFSTAYFSALNAGRHIQAVLITSPIIFLLNFLVAVPMLLLLRRHPGKSFLECVSQVAGKAGTVVLALVYLFFFLLQGVGTLGNFQLFYLNGVIPDSKLYAIAIPLLIVCVYGAVRGIETIGRFSGIALFIYCVIVLLIILSLLGIMNTDYLFPLLFHDRGYIGQALLFRYNSNTQLLILASCTQFLKPGVKPGRVYAHWNIIAALMVFVIELVCVLVMGPFASKQIFPIYTLSEITQLGVFERMDAFHMVAWIMESVLTVTVYLYLALDALSKIGVRRFRVLSASLFAAMTAFFAYFVTTNNQQYLAYLGSALYACIVSALLFVIPLLILLVDIIKERVRGDESRQGNPVDRETA
jgi:spore germination protein KB